jgi:hypothetical protein
MAFKSMTFLHRVPFKKEVLKGREGGGSRSAPAGLTYESGPGGLVAQRYRANQGPTVFLDRPKTCLPQ